MNAALALSRASNIHGDVYSHQLSEYEREAMISDANAIDEKVVRWVMKTHGVAPRRARGHIKMDTERHGL